MKAKLILLLKVAVTVAILTYFFLTIGIGTIVENVLTANPVVVLLVFFGLFVLIFLNSMNLFVIFYPKRRIPVRVLFRNYIVAWAAGFFFPGKLGELSIIYFLRKEAKISNLTAIVLLDKFITFMLLSFVSLIGIFLAFGQVSAGIVAAIALPLIAVIFIFFTNTGHRIVERIMGGKFHHFEEFSAVVAEYVKKHKRFMALDLSITIVSWAVNTAILMLIINSLGGEIGFLNLYFVIATSILAGLIPISINGLGVKEGTFVFLASFFGLAPAISFSASILFTVIGYALATSVLVIKTITAGKKTRG